MKQCGGWIPTQTGPILETVSLPELDALGIKKLAVSLSPLWARPGIEVLQQNKSLSKWINATQEVIAINGLEWFHQYNVNVKAKPQGISYRAPYDGSEYKITLQEFLALQIETNMDALVTLSAPHYAFKNNNALSILTEWITAAVNIVKQHNKKVFIELPCLAEAEMISLVKTFAMEDAVAGVVFFLENKPGIFLIEQQIIDNVLAVIPKHWVVLVNSNLALHSLQTLQEKNIDFIITETPFNDAKRGEVYFTTGSSQLTSMDMSNPLYAANTEALVENCQCDTCQQFTKAYLHHLLNAKEVFAWRLMAVHNWWCVSDLN